MLVAVGAVLFGLGALSGRAGPKLGTALALAPLAVWFGVLAWLIQTGTLEGPKGEAHANYLFIGLIAFSVGSNLTTRPSSPRGPRRDH
ncbi:hypothetical protein EDF44_4008 [Rathayibacter sp. PhB185]|nr:hypothetical protein EDF45_3959 [Rathayibacter sp. PhB186]ROS46697.1 hypothetical protein EDF44_4008 [Rathayibacter sp. PhB185]TCL82979.1 hypothetical protein EDF49_10432 [Rathayibacter sp. PhB192]TCM28476.1 hypothetical protein EDF43_10432 [Rathayibacter sp. PhB179]